MTSPAVNRDAVLCDPDLDATLRREGFVVIPFLDAREVEEVRRAYETIRPEGETGMAIDYSRYDRALVREITTLLSGVWDLHLPGLFHDREAILSTFLTKYPGPDSAMRMHREPTFVAPENDDPYNIWVSLVDVAAAEENGVLEVVPGTQHLPPWLSGYDTPEIFKPYEAFLRRHSRPVDVPAGWAVIFHAHMLHYSDPNSSAHPRLAFGAVVARQGSTLVHVTATGRRGRRVYRVDPPFITDCHPLEVGEYLATKDFPVCETHDPAKIDPIQLAEVMGVSERPEAIPVVPDDVLGDDALESLRVVVPSSVAGARVAVRDVTKPVWALGEHPEGAGGVTVEAVDGATGIGPVEAVEHSELRADLTALAGPRPADATVVALGPHARVTLAAPDDRALDLTVYECSVTAAGARGDDWVSTLEIGTRVTAAIGGRVTLWNSGPGALWAVAAPVGRWRRLIRRR